MADLTCRICKAVTSESEAACLNCGAPLPRVSGSPVALAPLPSSSGEPSPGDPFGEPALSLVVNFSDRSPLELTKGERILIGRHDDSPLRSSCGDNISRRHAELYVTDHGAFIEDLGSTNGTAVDGLRLPPNEPFRLAGSACVSLGNSPPLVFQVEVQAG